MMKKRIALWMAICMIALLAAACAQPAPGGGTPTDRPSRPRRDPGGRGDAGGRGDGGAPGAKGYRPVGRAERAHLHGHGEAAVRWGTGTDPKQL